MADPEALKARLAEIEEQIRQTRDRLPAHSVKPQLMIELFALEDEREAILAQLTKTGQAPSPVQAADGN